MSPGPRRGHRRRRRYRLGGGWPGVAQSIVEELADLLPPPVPEGPFAFLEPEDPIRGYCQDGKDEAADRSWADETSLLRAHPSVFDLQATPPASLARLRRLTASIASGVPSCSVPNHRSQGMNGVP